MTDTKKAPPNTIVIRRPKSQQYDPMIRIIGALMNEISLSEREIEFVSHLCDLPKRDLSTENRKELAERMNMTPQEVNNYIKRLKDKNILDTSLVLHKVFNIVQPAKSDKLLIQVGVILE